MRLGRGLGYLTHCLLWVAVAMGSPLGAQEVPEDWRIERLEWSSKAEDGQAVTVVNPYGDVRARAGRGQEVFVVALVQRHQDDPRQAKVFSAQGEGESLKVELGYPETDLSETIPTEWQKRRLDVTVYLPGSAPVAITAPRGLVQVKGLRGDLKIATQRGRVVARGGGRMSITTEHGSILAQLLHLDWGGTARLETRTGQIRVELPKGQRLATLMETRGEITTDYSLEIERVPGSGLKRALTIPVDSPRRIELRSYQGDIQLIESAVLASDGEEPLE